MSVVAIIGAGGQLGSDLVLACGAAGHTVVPLDLPELDLCRPDETRAALARIAPQLVINTAAFHAVDACEERVRETLELNVVAVRALARICRDLDAVLMQLSSDFVFGGAGGRPWTERDVPEPQSVYAISRLAGEQMVRATWGKHYLVRTCGLYGKAGRRAQGASFVEIMLRLAAAGRPIRVVDDQHVTPTATRDLAEKLVELMATGAFGLFHVTNAGECTWYEFACEIFRLAGLSPDLAPTSTAAYGSPARRPAYSVLDNAALRALGLTPLRHWRAALADYLRERAAEGS